MEHYTLKEVEKLKKSQLFQIIQQASSEIASLKEERDLYIAQNQFQKLSIQDFADTLDKVQNELESVKEELKTLKRNSSNNSNNLVLNESNSNQNGQMRGRTCTVPEQNEIVRKPLINLKQAIVESEDEYKKSNYQNTQIPIQHSFSGKSEMDSSFTFEVEEPDNVLELGKDQAEIKKSSQTSQLQRDSRSTTSSLQTALHHGRRSDSPHHHKEINLFSSQTLLEPKVMHRQINQTRENNMLLKSIHTGSVVINQGENGYLKSSINCCIKKDKDRLNYMFNSINIINPNPEEQPKNLLAQNELKEIPQKVSGSSSYSEGQKIHSNQNQSQPILPNSQIPQNENLIGIVALNNQQCLQAPIGSKLFQGFFIMGPQISSMREAIQNQSFSEFGIVPPEVYTSFPFCQNKGEEAQRTSLKKYCFPYDVTIQKRSILHLSDGKIDDLLNQMIFKKHSVKKSSSMYLIRMLGEQECPLTKNGAALKSSNPLTSLYSICYTFDNFYTVPASQGLPKTEEKCVYLAPMTLCFMTYYPFIDFFLDIIQSIAENLQKIRKEKCLHYSNLSVIEEKSCIHCHPQLNDSLERSLQLSCELKQKCELKQSENNKSRSTSSGKTNFGCHSCTGKILVKLLELDGQYDINNFFKDQMAPILKSLEKLQHINPFPDSQLNFSFTNQEIWTKLTYQIPSENKLALLEAQWGAFFTFSCLPFEDFLYVLTAVCLEQKVVFFSESFTCLTSSLMTFPSLMKPISYPFSSISSLHEDIQGLLETFIPSLFGINKGIAYKLELEEQGYDFSDKIVVDLDAGIAFAEDPKMESYLQQKMLQFKNNQSLLSSNYFKINSDPSQKVNGFHKSRPKKSLLGFCSPDKAQSPSSFSIKRAHMEPDLEQTKAIDEILIYIKNTFQQMFFVTLPKKEKVMKDQLDLEILKKKVLKKVSHNKTFAGEFVKTQSFTSFAEDYYSLL